MSEAGVQRRLAAIMAVDVVGYSRLMGADEARTHTVLRKFWREEFRPVIVYNKGRVVKMLGDGALVEFSSAVDAVTAAIALQETRARRNSEDSSNPPMVFRIGINLGDIVMDDGDVFGRDVNLAARLESRSPEGGVLISDSVYTQIVDKISGFRNAGPQTFKNIDRPVQCWVWEVGAEKSDADDGQPSAHMTQKIQFCRSHDGIEIAYATAGSGPPLVRAPHWMSHLEFDWETPVWRHTMEELCREHTLVRFDQRGNGLSDWDVESISFEDSVKDLAAVVDAAGLDTFPLLGISQGCAISIAYAIQNPNRVTHLILYGGFARGRDKRGSATLAEEADALRTLIRLGWGQENPAFRQLFTSTFMPGGKPEQWDWFNELQRISVSPENAARIRNVSDVIDISDLLGRINVPTLVMHCRDDAVVPFSEGRRMAARIPGARFVPLEGQNHIIIEDEPCWPVFINEIHKFLQAG